MNRQDFEIRTTIIRETFNDLRKIKYSPTQENNQSTYENYTGGDIFITENGEIIDLEFQIDDFTSDELVKFVEFAEELYDKHGKHVSIYIICPSSVNVCVKECEIMSEADFTIKLSCIQEDPAHIILNMIKDKLNNGESLNDDDIEALKILPMKCNKKDRNFFRKEQFEIMTKLDY